MLKSYVARMDSGKVIPLRAHSKLDAAWRLRSMLGKKKLPDRTKIEQTETVPASEPKPAAIKITIRQEDLNKIGRPDIAPADVAELLGEIIKEDYFGAALKEAVACVPPDFLRYMEKHR